MKTLFFLFLYVCCLANTLPLFFPGIHLLIFVPFLVISLYKTSLNQALWISLGCGFLLDLYSTQVGIGTYAFIYCLTTFCLYPYKTHFFEDGLSTLPVMTFIYGVIAGLVKACFLLAIGNLFLFSWEWVKIDLFLIPFQTAIYSIAFLKVPQFLFVYVKKLRYEKSSAR